MRKAQILLGCLILLISSYFLFATSALANTQTLITLPITFPQPSPTQTPITFPHNSPTPSPTPMPSPTPLAEVQLGGLSLNDYCISLGQNGVSLTGNTWRCQPSGNAINFSAACQRQYHNPAAFAKQLNPNNPFTWQCFVAPPTTDFRAQYFDNQTLSGVPKLTRIDSKINFVFGDGSPDPLIPNDHFSARWTRTKFMEAGKYSFTLKADDGIRFIVDNTVVVNDFTDHATKTYTPDIMVKAGNHTFTIEYFEDGGTAVAILNEDFPARDRTTPTPIIIP